MSGFSIIVVSFQVGGEGCPRREREERSGGTLAVSGL
jgi:hypothetical protein